MHAIKILNQTLAFSLELAMLASLGYYGFHCSSNVLVKYALVVALPVVAAILWGIFAAPRSGYRLAQPARMFFALAMFLISALLLYRAGSTKLAAIFAILAVANELLALVLGE